MSRSPTSTVPGISSDLRTPASIDDFTSSATLEIIDPRKIPKDPSKLSSIDRQRVLASLDALRKMGRMHDAAAMDAAVKIWPKTFAWVEFIYQSCVKGSGMNTKVTLRGEVSNFATEIIYRLFVSFGLQSTTLRKQMLSTNGCMEMIGSMWLSCDPSEVAGSEDQAAMALRAMIILPQPIGTVAYDKKAVQAVVACAGGKPEAVLAKCLRELARLIKLPRATMPYCSFTVYGTLIIALLSPVLVSENLHRQAVQLAHTIVDAMDLIRSTWTGFDPMWGEGEKQIFLNLFPCVISFLTFHSPKAESANILLNTGFLQSIWAMNRSSKPGQARFPFARVLCVDIAKSFFRRLPSMFTLSSTLEALKKPMRDCLALETEREDYEVDFMALWIPFKEKALHRFNTLARFEQLQSNNINVGFTGCGNFVCNNNRSRNQKLFRCSGCMDAEYCSRACQKSDWKKHKPDCEYQRNTEYSKGSDPKMYIRKNKEKEFRKYCVLEDTADLVAEILKRPKQDEFIFIHVDYYSTPPKVSEERPEVNSYFEGNWLNAKDALSAMGEQFVYAWGTFISGMVLEGFCLYFSSSHVLGIWEVKELGQVTEKIFQ